MLEGVHGGFYQPSLDDIGARILCQCSDASDEAASTFAEYGPVVLGALGGAGAAVCWHRLPGRGKGSTHHDAPAPSRATDPKIESQIQSRAAEERCVFEVGARRVRTAPRQALGSQSLRMASGMCVQVEPTLQFGVIHNLCVTRERLLLVRQAGADGVAGSPEAEIVSCPWTRAVKV